MMANDTFVQEWLTKDEENNQRIERYLEAIKNKYDMFNTFLVSDKTKNYYTQSGFVEKVDENNQPTEEVEDMYKLIDGLTYTDEEKAAIDKLNAVVKANDTEAIKAEVKVFAEFVLKLINDGGDFDDTMPTVQSVISSL